MKVENVQVAVSALSFIDAAVSVMERLKNPSAEIVLALTSIEMARKEIVQAIEAEASK